MGKTSTQWWDSTKTDPEKLGAWLVKQYRGEVTAAQRIVAFAEKLAPDAKTKEILNVIAGQERQHAEWVLSLLESRGLVADVSGLRRGTGAKRCPASSRFRRVPPSGPTLRR